MELKITLHGVLREKLPAEARGKTCISMPEGTTIADVIGYLGLSDAVVASVNDVLTRDRGTRLKDGDALRFFRPGAGGGYCKLVVGRLAESTAIQYSAVCSSKP
ncbi:MAG: MoaD/ThiS family protein [Anaerolineae bacterium]|nr:MoaD/ThiS family protein [Anaerolineae bacterium]